MFRGYMPALTLFVFCVGLGIGVCWSCGLIPLTYTPAKSGSLSAEFMQREPLPPPNDSELVASDGNQTNSQAAIVDDPEVFENQTEPEIDREIVPKTRRESYENPSPRESRVVRDERRGAPTSSPTSDLSAETSLRPFRVRGDLNSTRPESRSTKEEPVAPVRPGKVSVAAHQEPDSSGEARQGNAASLSPREQLAAAEEKLAAGETLAAHREFSKLYWNHKELRPLMQETIDSTAKAIFFQSKPHYIEPYVIQEGDRLEAIAKKYQLSWEYLAKLNRTEPRRIQIGQKLKVVKGPFGAVVDLKEFALTIHLQGYYVKRYVVGIGKDGSSPVGKFPVLNKVENPPYTAPNGKVIAADDPSNPLGERWIDLGESYGIHGTVDPNSIGKAESRGCIRLRDSDIIEVYDFLVKGSEVVLRK